MTINRKCPACDSERLESGSIQSTGRIYFRPDNTKFMTLGTNDVELSAILCMECGHVMLVGDLRKADKLLYKDKAH